MTIDEVYLGMANNIVNAIQRGWDGAVVDVEKPAEDVISFSVSYLRVVMKSSWILTILILKS